VYFFPKYGNSGETDGIWLFTGGSVVYVIGISLNGFDLYLARRDPSLQHQRLLLTLANSKRRKIISLFLSNRAKVFILSIYMVGTLLFCFGSPLFLPSMPPGLKAFAFFCFILGSALFLLGAALNFYELFLKLEYRRLLRQYEGRSWEEVKREHTEGATSEEVGRELQEGRERFGTETVTHNATRIQLSDIEIVNP